LDPQLWKRGCAPGRRREGGEGRKGRESKKGKGCLPLNKNPGYGRHWCSAESQQSSDVAYVAEQIVVCCSEDRKLITVITHTAAAAAAAALAAVAAVSSRWRDESAAWRSTLLKRLISNVLRWSSSVRSARPRLHCPTNARLLGSSRNRNLGEGRFGRRYRFVVFSRPLQCNVRLLSSNVVCLSSVTRVYCGQTVSWIRMPLGMQVGLVPGHIVLDWDPALLPKGAQPPILGPYLLRPNGCMDQDVTWYGGRPWPKWHCIRWGPSSSHRKGHSSPPQFFRPMSIVAKRLHGLGFLVVCR